MLSLTHTIISLPFAAYLQNPVIIFTAAFLFHLLTDSILHWNIDSKKQPYPYKFVALDVLGGIVIAALISLNHLPIWSTMAAILGGNAPDIIQALWNILGSTKHSKYILWLKPFSIFHQRIQRETNNIPQGLASQIILIALALTLVLQSKA